MYFQRVLKAQYQSLVFPLILFVKSQKFNHTAEKMVLKYNNNKTSNVTETTTDNKTQSSWLITIMMGQCA